MSRLNVGGVSNQFQQGGCGWRGDFQFLGPVSELCLRVQRVPGSVFRLHFFQQHCSVRWGALLSWSTFVVATVVYSVSVGVRYGPTYATPPAYLNSSKTPLSTSPIAMFRVTVVALDMHRQQTMGYGEIAHELFDCAS